MYRLLELELTDNPIGSDSRVGLYKAINRRFAGLELSIENSKIVKIQPNASNEYPNRTIVFIIKINEPTVEYRFVYNRFELGAYLNSSVFDNAQRIELNNGSSVTLVNELAIESGLNLRADEFWTHPDRIVYSGGSKGPNFLLEAIPGNIWFYGKFIIPLDFIIEDVPVIETVPLTPLVPATPIIPLFPLTDAHAFSLAINGDADFIVEPLVIIKIEMVKATDYSEVIGQLNLETFLSSYIGIEWVPDVGLKIPIHLPYAVISLRGTPNLSDYCLKITKRLSEDWIIDYIYTDAEADIVLEELNTSHNVNDTVIYICNRV